MQDNDFQTWWIDAHEYITCYDLLRNNPEYYDDLGGKAFFENRLKIWFKEHPFYLQPGIYFFNNEDTPALDLIGDTFFDLYELFQNGTFDVNMWRDNFFPHELTTEEIASLKEIKINNLTEEFGIITLNTNHKYEVNLKAPWLVNMAYLFA